MEISVQVGLYDFNQLSFSCLSSLQSIGCSPQETSYSLCLWI